MVSFPRVSINTDMRDGLCFGCGQNNPIGLKLSFQRDGRGVRTEFTPDGRYQGWPGVVHGGIITSILDEAMSHAARVEQPSFLTARIEIKFRRPAPVAETMVVTASVTRSTRKLIETEGRICLQDGTPVAEGRATQFIVTDGSRGSADA